MGAYSNFPYTNYHELNLDWLIAEMKKLVDAWEGFNSRVDADAYQSVDPEVSVTGDLQTGLTFTFGLPRGAQGAAGAPGTNGVGIATATVDAAGNFSITLTDSTVINLGNIKGPEGQQGAALEILGEYDTLADLQTAHPVGNVGDTYLVGTGGVTSLYVWDPDTSTWKDGGSLASPSPYTNTPAMDGIGSAGSSLAYAKGDHVHPADTSKQAVLASGTVTLNGSAIPAAGNIDLVDSSSLSTINTQSIQTGADLSANDIGCQPELTTGSYSVSINGAAIPAASNVDLMTTTALSMINGNSLQTGTNLSLTSLGIQAELDDNQLNGNFKLVHGTSLLGTGDVEMIYYGTGDPDAGTGNDGDIYIKYTA